METKELKEQTGNLVSFDNYVETENISKKVGYLNYRNEGKEEKTDHRQTAAGGNTCGSCGYPGNDSGNYRYFCRRS